jgi:hypothetical protein
MLGSTPIRRLPAQKKHSILPASWSELGGVATAHLLPVIQNLFRAEALETAAAIQVLTCMRLDEVKQIG